MPVLEAGPSGIARILAPWRLTTWRAVLVIIGGLLLAGVGLLKGLPYEAVAWTSLAAVSMLIAGLRLWTLPLVVAVPHLLAAGLCAVGWETNYGALHGWLVIIHLVSAAAVIGLVFLGNRALVMIYIVPAVASGVTIATLVADWVGGTPDATLIPTVALMAMQLLAGTIILLTLNWYHALLLWSLVCSAALWTNQMGWRTEQIDAIRLMAYLRSDTSGDVRHHLPTAPLGKDGGMRWGRADAPIQVAYVCSLDDAEARMATTAQLREFLALAPKVGAGAVAVTVDVVSTQGHVIPVFAYYSWDIFMTQGGTEQGPKQWLIRLCDSIAINRDKDIRLTLLDMIQDSGQDRDHLMDISSRFPVLLGRLDRRLLALHEAGMVAAPAVTICSGSRPEGRSILLRTAELVSTEKIQSFF